MEITSIISTFILIFAALIVIKGIRIVKQSESMIIERLGKYSSTLEAGINVIIPIIDKPRTVQWRYAVEDGQGRRYVTYKSRERIDLRETVFDFPKQSVITKDNVVTEINALIYFQIVDPVKSVYEINNLPNAIEKLTQTTLRNVIGELELDDCLASRDTINNKLRIILDDATNKWGVKVNRVELQDINPPQDIKEAMEKQMRAERNRRAQIIEAEGTKKATVLHAEGQKEAAINEAEGHKQAKILYAEGEATARIKVAEAEAQAIQKIAEAVVETKADPAQYLIAIKYIDTLEQILREGGAGQKTVFMPYEASGLMSSVGGLKELLENK
ncbi:MAG: SPFH domain-containing protein [Flavobacteriales bacterium]|jgi:regulator of protease activity HflC (stomatin/prohibitin superfamily)